MQQNERITSLGIGVLLICGVTPFMRIVIGESGILSFVLIPAILLIGANYKKYCHLSFFKIQIMLLSFWLMFSALYSPVASSITLEKSKVQICTIILFLYFLNKKEEKILVILAFFASFVFIYCYFFSSEFYMAGIRKRILWQENTWLDPNIVIASFIIPCLYSVELFINNKSIILKMAIAVFWGLSLYCAFLGASRGGTIAILIGTVVYLVIRLTPSVKHIFSALGAIALIVVIYNIVKKYIPESLLQRMTLANVAETGGSGRIDIYHNYIDSFFSDTNLFRFFFGYGKESCKLYLGKSAHNVFIDYLWDLGIVGLVAYLAVIGSMIKYCIISKSALSISCIIAIIVWSLGISTSDQLLYWVLLYTCIVFANNEMQVKNNNQVES